MAFAPCKLAVDLSREPGDPLRECVVELVGADLAEYEARPALPPATVSLSFEDRVANAAAAAVAAVLPIVASGSTPEQRDQAAQLARDAALAEAKKR